MARTIVCYNERQYGKDKNRDQNDQEHGKINPKKRHTSLARAKKSDYGYQEDETTKSYNWKCK
jgi:hypothetical protein